MGMVYTNAGRHVSDKHRRKLRLGMLTDDQSKHECPDGELCVPHLNGDDAKDEHANCRTASISIQNKEEVIRMILRKMMAYHHSGT